MNIEPGTQIHQHVTAVAGTAYGVIGADLHVFGDGTPLYLLEEHRPAAVSDRAWLQELPSRMLNARAGVVAFTGRDRERDELHTWRESWPRLAVRWLHAPGGQGKTRLADHVAAQAVADGWKAVVAVPDVGTVRPSPSSQDLRLDGHRGVLLIVDYADRWPLSILIWLLRNSLLHQHGKQARVLLLARSTAAWPALRATLEDPRVQAGTSQQHLEPLPATDGDRWAMFTSARDSFAAIYQIPDPAVLAAPIGLDHPDFGLTLTVHVAALVAVDAHATGDQPPTHADQLTRYLLDRERQHWTRLHEGSVRGLDHHTPPSVMTRTVFTAALTGPLPHPEAFALLGRVEQELPAERILTDHSRCYPSTDPNRANVLEPLYPDRLAEDFIAHTLPGANHPAEPWAPTRLDELLQPPPPSSKRRWWQRDTSAPSADPVYLARVITFLTAASARWPHLGPAHLYPMLRARPQLAITAGSGTLTTLATIPNVDIDIIEAIAFLLPEDRHVDLDVGAAAISTVFTAHRLATIRDSAEHARLHATHAQRLAHAGRYQDALASSQEAVAIRRRLAEANPAAYLPDLAMAVNDFSIWLSQLGRREEALTSSQEATSIYLELAQSDPDAYQPDFAASLNNLGNLLSQLGQRKEALASSQEAVAIRRRLAKANPGAYLPDLAMSLDNLGTTLSELGHLQQALAPAEEAVASYRRLVEANPDAYLPDLARSLNNLGNRLLELGHLQQALAPAEEAVAIRRRMAEANPDAYLPDLARSLNNFGAVLSQLGRPEQALGPAQEATNIYRRLVEANPDAYLPDLAMLLTNLGNRLLELGQYQQALAPAEEAVASYRRLVEANPAAYLPDLARSLKNLGAARGMLDRHSDALGPAEEAASAYRRLVEANPAAYLPDLAGSLNSLGGVLSQMGRPEDALGPVSKSVVVSDLR